MRTNKYHSHFGKIVKNHIKEKHQYMIVGLIYRAEIIKELSKKEIIELAHIIQEDIENGLATGGTTMFDDKLYYRQENGEWFKGWSYGGVTEAR
jgi:hypothetical protein